MVACLQDGQVGRGRRTPARSEAMINELRMDNELPPSALDFGPEQIDFRAFGQRLHLLGDSTPEIHPESMAPRNGTSNEPRRRDMLLAATFFRGYITLRRV